MTTIKLEVSDELAAQLSAVRDHLPALLHEVLLARPLEQTSGILKSGALHPAYREMFDFLASGPTPKQIAAYRPSSPLQERVADLLERNRESGLSAEDSAELDGFEQVDDLLSLLAARARSIEP